MAGEHVQSVLVVEDEADIRALLRVILRLSGRFTVSGEAASADEAVAAASASAPDVIILDQALHGNTTGIDVAPRLRTLCPDALIVLFSSKDLKLDADAEPAIDVFIRKSEIDVLPRTLDALVAS